MNYDPERFNVHYSPDLVFFDIVPSFQSAGADSYRDKREGSFRISPPAWALTSATCGSHLVAVLLLSIASPASLVQGSERQ